MQKYKLFVIQKKKEKCCYRLWIPSLLEKEEVREGKLCALAKGTRNNTFEMTIFCLFLYKKKIDIRCTCLPVISTRMEINFLE